VEGFILRCFSAKHSRLGDPKTKDAEEWVNGPHVPQGRWPIINRVCVGWAAYERMLALYWNDMNWEQVGTEVRDAPHEYRERDEFGQPTGPVRSVNLPTEFQVMGKKPLTTLFLEEDVVPYDAFINGMFDCPEPICVAPIEAHVRNTPKGSRGPCSYGVCTPGPCLWNNTGEVRRGDEWAEFSGLGCVKVKPEVRELWPWKDLTPGKANIDGRLWQTLRSRRGGMSAAGPLFPRLHVHWADTPTGALRHTNAYCLGATVGPRE
jgi:hypothetical protein